MEVAFSELVDKAAQLLRDRGRVSHQALRREFGLDDELMEDLRSELVDVLQIATDRDGKILELDLRASAGAQPREDSVKGDVAERRRLTVLFCDLVGSTPLAEQLDPEDLRSIMRSYQAVCGDVIKRFGGHISQWIGDGVVVYYGYPSGLEDDAFRAVRTGLGILDELKPITTAARTNHGVDIQVRVGIHSGVVVIGDVGAGSQGETLAFGETPNIGARIEAAAEPGTVAISEITYNMVEGLFEFEPLGPHDLKGVSGPMHLYRPIAVSKAVGRFDVIAAAGLSELVDREEERASLIAIREKVVDEGAVGVLLMGEAGIGKSRLVHAVKHTSRETGWSIIDCRCSPFRQNSALFPVAEGIRHWLELENDEVTFDSITALMSEAADLDADQAAPLLAELLDVAFDPAEFSLEGVAPGRRRQITMQALVELVRLATRRAPTLLVIEDVHWVDPSTLEWVQMVMDQIVSEPLMLLMTARPTFEMPWGDAVETLTLDRLQPEDTKKLVALASGGAVLDDEMVERLVQRTDGVPLFVEELTKTVVESKATGSVARDAVGDSSIPDTLYGALIARIDQMGGARVVAQEAAIIGREFDYGLLAAITRSLPEELDESLNALVGAGVLFKQESGESAVYTFKHALVQEVTGQSMLRSVAQPYNGAIAEALLQRFPERAQARPELVAMHFTAAGRSEDAIPHWVTAGLGAIQKFAMNEAISYLSSALAMVEKLPPSPARDNQEIMVQVLRAVPLTMTRGWASPDVGAAYERAHDLLDEAGDDPQLFPTLVGLFTYDLVSGQIERAMETATHNLGVAERIGDEALLLEAHGDAGNALFYRGGHTSESSEHLQIALDLYEPERHHRHVHIYGKDPGAVADVHLALDHWMKGDLDRALEVAKRGVERTEEWLHPFSHVWALLGLVVVHRNRGELEDAQRVAQRAIAEAGEQGFPNWVAQCQVHLGWALAAQGKTEEGIGLIQDGMGLWQLTGAQLMTPYFESELAEAYAAAGKYELALGVIDSALNRVEKSGERWWEPEIRRIRGELLLASTSDEQEAEAEFDAARAKATEHGAVSLSLRATLSKARLLARQGRFEEIRAELAEIHDSFTEGLETKDLQEARSLLVS